uniref:F-box domain-containing protein n=1 Tax=Caenorhabditis tropicalis TaxID=1561998 RepID=A0A1I7TP03_9PELO
MKKSFGGMTLQGNNGSVFSEVPSTVASKAMNPAARYLASRRDKTTVTSDLTHSNKALGGVASQKNNGFKQVGNVLDSTKMNGQHPTDQSGEGQDQKNSVNLNKSFGGFDRQQGEGAKDGDQRSSKNLNKSFGGFDANKVNTRYQQRLNRKLKKQQQRASNPDIPQEVTQKVPEASITVKTPSTVGVSSMDVPKTAVHSDPSANIENSQENSSLLNKSSDSSHLGNYTVDTTHQKSHDSSTKGPMNKSLGGMTLQGNNGSVFTEKPSTVPPKSMNPAARYLASRRDENTAQGTNNSKDLNKSLCGTKSNSQRQACQDGKGQGPKTPINLNKTFGGFNDQNVNSNISKDRGSKNSKNLNKSFGGYAANGENVSSKQQQQEVIQKEAPVPETSITSMAALTDNGSIEDVSKTVAEDVSINLNWTLPAGNLHEAFKEEEDIYSNQTINCSIASSQFVRTQPSAVKVFAYYEKQRENNGEKMNRKVWDLIDGGDEMAILLDKLKTKNRELTETEIKQLVLADPTSLRLCILYEVVGKKSIIESFLNITKIIGTQDIDCNDFEFWFKRFESGNWDLNQKTLFDMPIEILTNIVEELDFLTQMQLRKVSHGLRHIVDDVRFSIDEIICDFEKYGKSKGLAIMVYGPNEDPEKEFNTFKYHEDDSERALNDLRILLENRHLRLDRLEWRDDGSPAIKKQLINMLSSLNHKLEINCLEINANGDVMIGLMKAIKPATLEEISCESELLLFHIDRIAQLEQWKKAKYVYFPTVIFELAFSYHHFMHFKYVDVHVVSISIGDIFFIKQLFSQNNVLDRFICYSKNRPSISDIEDSLGPSEISLDEDHESFSDFEQGVYRIYSIPGSEDVLQLSLTNDDVIFVKGSKESV